MVHSTPWEPRGSYVLPHSAALERFGEADADIVLYGHTHRQVVRRIGRVLVVNPGSAGEARDPRNGGEITIGPSVAAVFRAGRPLSEALGKKKKAR